MKDDRLISLNAAIHVIKDALLSWSNMPEWRENKIVGALDKLPPAYPSATDTNVATTDTISRRAVLDVLHGYFDGMLETDTVCPKDLYNGIEALPSAQQWIKVTPKTLPKKVGDYLVTTHSGQIARYIYMGNGTSKDYWMRCVVAWMPLPEPWKGGQNG